MEELEGKVERQLERQMDERVNLTEVLDFLHQEATCRIEDDNQMANEMKNLQKQKKRLECDPQPPQATRPL